MSTATFSVVGMTCGFCVNAVTREVSEIRGVSGIDVDLASGRLTMTSEGAVDRNAVVAAVQDAGYLIADR